MPPVDSFEPAKAPVPIGEAIAVGPGTELPHRCIFCNSEKNLWRGEAAVPLYPWGVLESSKFLALFQLVPIAAAWPWLCEREMRLTYSTCRWVEQDSHCWKCRRYEEWDHHQGELWIALNFGFAMLASIGIGKYLFPNQGDRSGADLFVVLFFILFVVQLYANWGVVDWLQRRPYVVGSARGGRLYGCGEPFLAALRNDPSFTRIPPPPHVDPLGLLPPGFARRPVYRDAEALAVVPDWTVLPQRCAHCDVSTPQARPISSWTAIVPLRRYRGLRDRLLGGCCWWGPAGLLEHRLGIRLGRIVPIAYFLCEDHRRAWTRRERRRTLWEFAFGMVVFLAGLHLTLLLPPGWWWAGVGASALALVPWLGRSREPLTLHDCDDTSVRLSGCCDAYLRRFESRP